MSSLRRKFKQAFHFTPKYLSSRHSTSNGTATGNSMLNGTVTGNSTSNGTATGNSVLNGTATGNSVLNGTATGNSTSNGTATGNSTSNGTATGNSMLTWALYSSSTSNGTAYGNDRALNGVAPSGNTVNGTNSEHRHQAEGSDVEADCAGPEPLVVGRIKASKAPVNQRTVECAKHPGHTKFTQISDLNIHNLPPSYQNQCWVDYIRLKGKDTVHIDVTYTSENRPEELGFSEFKGTNKRRTGSGTVFLANMDNIQDCNCSEIPGAHKVSGWFKVMTVAHVVFDNKEAQNTVVTFFYDDEDDRSTTVEARGVRVSHIDVDKNRSVFECRTHDLTLYQRLLSAQQEREYLKQNFLSSRVQSEQMVVLISHPHGLSKLVSIGKLIEIKEEGEIKTTKEGVELIGCIMTYDTPTCPGTGGGSINLIGSGEVCLAFAPHCASIGERTNISSLGWTKYVKTMQLRTVSS